MCDLARDMNPAIRVVEKTDFLDDLGDRVITKAFSQKFLVIRRASNGKRFSSWHRNQ